ncbi:MULTISPECIES: hypothetical protein [unclassified Novosphingobium]|uniref:hypothetical protein n=1 Tax=unclassified Novosphingobium TaxID=2644732 RepID=UPI00086988D7|nr:MULTISPECIES: hypothetical protein [unclassified Novosphingobium]MBN9142357.1 hypothetical protein [Novosphingobium sp.]ODU77646.1 MAG: hypothetical protein ABT10_24280 [Novosphingobium sp. SCN 63-17]OJX90165.1 MAG: hypothetical protein BGP00_21455 [Novosphingobium sp. 63-713]
MVDYYTSACFTIAVTPAEAALLEEASRVCDVLCHDLTSPEQEQAFYAECSEPFRARFPITDPDAPFAGFRAMFDDPTYPRCPADWTTLAAEEAGRVSVSISGDDVDPYSLAGLLRHLCPSALPLCFGWANTPSRACHDAYSGGYYEVRAEGIFRVLDDCEDIDAGHLVIAMFDPEEGLLFWNKDDGFGSLEQASVFTEKEADRYDLPIADAQPEWIALPPRKAFVQVVP